MYNYLHDSFHQITQSEFEEEYKKKYNSQTTIYLPFEIRSLNYSEKFPAFLNIHINLINLLDEIYQQDQQIRKIMELIPDVAQKDYIIGNLVDELQSTNDLEGVRSTRAEMAEGTKLFISKSPKTVRHQSLIRTYNKLLSGDIEIPKTSNDIREIFDFLLQDSIEKESLLDGTIFRKEGSEVLANNGTGKVIHRGVSPEKEVIKEMDKLLDFLNNFHLPMLFKVSIAHYYFGYIHPFYDGNGRTSRFISSIYLEQNFNILIALSLSKGCNEFKSQYLRAFDITNSFKNKGDLTFFCETFCKIIRNTQINILNDMKEKIHQMNTLKDFVRNDTNLDSELERRVMYVLVQNHFFNYTDEGVSRMELVDFTQQSPYTINKVLDKLIKVDAIEKISSNPIVVHLKESYFRL
ncbi:Fic family protein [Bacillus sp. V59.32b]|uniref:Fic family protein n=1 Tax=Bacillus sp. V59.32b TaxID=1758642 RepID=UPI0013570E27|nr:Fic family protein [Bacillus sp. V59.32b]